MSDNWAADIAVMHDKYGVNEWVKKNPEKLKEYLKFRLNFIEEEFLETKAAAFVDRDPEEIVDGLIDICVVAIGTLDAFGVDANEAWTKVHKANMAKKVGVKKERPNPLGLPDLMKPEGWTAPSHSDNHGLFPDAV